MLAFTQSEPGAASPQNSRAGEILRGISMGLPVLLGYLPLGLAFGVLAVKSGIPASWAIIMSIVVYAGSGQLICASMMAGGASLLPIVLATGMVNLRHILMSAALAPHIRPLPKFLRALFAVEITDEAFAVHSTAFRQGAPCNPTRLFACNLTAHFGWVLGTLLGVLSGGMIADVRPWGLDYALVAMFLALLVPLCWERLHLLVAMAGAVLAIGFTMLGAGRGSVVLATLLAASLGLWLSIRRGDDLEALAQAGREEDQVFTPSGADFPEAEQSSKEQAQQIEAEESAVSKAQIQQVQAEEAQPSQLQFVQAGQAASSFSVNQAESGKGKS